MKKLLILLAVGAVTLMSSCVKPEKISIAGVESFQVKGITASQVGIDVGVRATNTSGTKLSLTDMELSLKKNGNKIVEVVLREKAVLPGKTSGIVTLPLSIRFEGPLGALGAYAAFSKGLENTTVSGYITAKAGWAKKRVEIPETPLDGLARQYGIDPAALLKNM